MPANHPPAQCEGRNADDGGKLALAAVNAAQLLQHAEDFRGVWGVFDVNALLWLSLIPHGKLCGSKSFARQGKNNIARLARLVPLLPSCGERVLCVSGVSGV